MTEATATTTASEKLTTDEFVAEMEAIRAKYTVMNTEFMQDMVAGRIPKDGLKRFAVQWYYFCVRTGYSMIEKPYAYRHDPEHVFRGLCQNAVGEIGYLDDGLAPHPSLAKDLCYGLGMTDEEIDETPILPRMYFHIEHAMSDRHKSRANKVVKGAYGIVEADGAHSGEAIGRALMEHYGVDEKAAGYFIAHGYRDAEHGRENAEIAATLSSTREEQEQALATAREAMKMKIELFKAYRTLY